MQSSTYTSDAIILARKDWREYDRLYTVLTPTGKKEVKAIGVRRMKSKLVGRIEPWMRARVMLVYGRMFDILADSVPETQWNAARNSFPAFFFASWFTECVDALVPIEDGTKDLFDLAESAFSELEVLASAETVVRSEWKAWWIRYTAALLVYGGYHEADIADTEDPEVMHWFLQSVVGKPFKTFPIISALL